MSQSQALPALASFVIPGLGQLVQGRVFVAFGWWITLSISLLSCFILVGFVSTPILWICCVVNAANYKG